MTKLFVQLSPEVTSYFTKNVTKNKKETSCGNCDLFWWELRSLKTMTKLLVQVSPEVTFYFTKNVTKNKKETSGGN